MKEEKETKKKPLKAILKTLEKDELVEVILELTKYNVKNKKFLEVFIQSNEEINFNDIIDEAKKKIYLHIWGRSINSKNSLQLRKAKNIIADTAKILKDYPQHIIDLKLYYVETCNDYTQSFGDISEQFYDSVLRVFAEFCNFINQNPSLYYSFKERLTLLYNNSRDIGWGYTDTIDEYIWDLRSTHEKTDVES